MHWDKSNILYVIIYFYYILIEKYGQNILGQYCTKSNRSFNIGRK